jgi:hypothetical protein
VIRSLAVAAALVAASAPIAAHKPVTSKYTYYQDVLPIVREKCATCHRPEGIAPMSLMTYEEAFPWAESIRAELIAGRMPPAPADPTFGAVQHNRFLTAREIDVMLTWATGGNPRGTGTPRAVPATDDGAWALGAPDAVLSLPATSLAADQAENTREFVLKAPAGVRWLRAVDLRPGTAAVVRDALVLVRDAHAAASPMNGERVLRRWMPGQVPVDAENEGLGFFVPAEAELVARVHYKKTYLYDGKELTDRSAIGLYFAHGAPKAIESLAADSPRPLASGASDSYEVAVPRDLEAVGLRVDSVPANVVIEVEGIPAGGSAVPLVRFAAQPTWERRYWFAHPVVLRRESRIRVRIVYRDPAFIADAFGGVDTLRPPQSPVPVRLTLDVAAQ